MVKEYYAIVQGKTFYVGAMDGDEVVVRAAGELEEPISSHEAILPFAAQMGLVNLVPVPDETKASILAKFRIFPEGLAAIVLTGEFSSKAAEDAEKARSAAAAGAAIAAAQGLSKFNHPFVGRAYRPRA